MSKMEGELKKCERCNIYVPAKTFASHLQEKRHRIREKRFTEMMQNSIFISCLPKDINEVALTEDLQKYGDVRSCSIIPRSNTAIVEFDRRESAEICLRGPVFIQDSLVKIAPRREPKPRAVPVPIQENDVAPEALVSLLERAHSFGGKGDADKLIELAVETVRAQNPERRRKMHILQRDLEACISQLIPNCSALQFGSAVTGLTLKGSDADIVIIGPNDQSKPFSDGPQLVKRTRKLLWGWRRTFGSIVAIPEARIPIVKLLHIPTGIACDISFQGQECVIKSRQLSRVLDLDYRIRPLIIFLKYWEKCHNIINLSRFSSYAATLMVVFFLQQLPVPMLPPVHKLLSSDPQRKDVLATAKYTYSELAEEFFRYYGETDFMNQVICPWLGRLVPFEAFCEVLDESLPQDIKNVRRLTLSLKTPLEMGTPLVVQDPYELNRNVTERVKEKDFIFFRLCCTEAVQVMKRGNPIFLFKNFCVPSEVDMTTTLKADTFLTPEYLGPTEGDETTTKDILFNRWLKAVLVLLPEFLAKFVRLKVESCDDVVKIPKISEASTSKCSISEHLPRKWNCTGKPVLQSWTMRKKTATKLKLSPELAMTERESQISEHLEQETSEMEDVTFTFLVRNGSRKESVRCTCAAYTANGPEFNSIAAKILSILPLWLKSAFECKKTLEYISELVLPNSVEIQNDLAFGTNILDNSAESSCMEENTAKVSEVGQHMIVQEQNISVSEQNKATSQPNIISSEQNITANKQNITANEPNIIAANKLNIIVSE